MRCRLYYTKNISNNDLISLTINEAKSVSNNEMDEIDEGAVVELLLRMKELHNPCTAQLYQKGLMLLQIFVTEERASKLINNILYNIVPKWKNSKKSIQEYFFGRKMKLKQRSRNTTKCIYDLKTKSYANKQLEKLLNVVEKQTGNLKMFIEYLLQHRPQECKEVIANDTNFQKENNVRVDFIIDASMQANWKDDIGLSYYQLRKMRKSLPDCMAGEKSVIEEMHQRNSHSIPVQNKIEMLPDGSQIIYSITDLKQKIEITAQKLIKEGLLYPNDETLKVKISGDGYLRTHKLGHVLFTFTFMDTMYAHQNYATWDLCVLDGSENMDNIAIVMKEISLQMQNAVEVNVDDSSYKIEYFVIADQKFLALILGIANARTKYFCPWCECPKDQRYCIEKDFPLRNMTTLHERAAQIAGKSINAIKAYARGDGKGTVQMPSLLNVEFSNIIPDIMHIFLRIVEKFLTCLYMYYEKDEQSCARYLSKIRLLLHDKSFKFETKSPTQFRKPRLDGATLKHIMRNANEQLIFSIYKEDPQKTAKLRELTTILTKLISDLWSEKEIGEQEQQELEVNLSKFSNLWLNVFNLQTWNNSCHILCKHVPLYTRLYGNIYRFSQENVESQVGRNKNFLKRTASKSSNNVGELLQFDNRKLDRLEHSLSKYAIISCVDCGAHNHQSKRSKKCTHYKQKDTNSL